MAAVMHTLCTGSQPVGSLRVGLGAPGPIAPKPHLLRAASTALSSKSKTAQIPLVGSEPHGFSLSITIHHISTSVRRGFELAGAGCGPGGSRPSGTMGKVRSYAKRKHCG